jgi:hypothetical protein
MAKTEEQRVLVVVKVERLFFGIGQQGLQLCQSLARDQGLLLSTDVLERFAGLFNMRQPVTIRGNHG